MFSPQLQLHSQSVPSRKQATLNPDSIRSFNQLNDIPSSPQFQIAHTKKSTDNPAQ